VSVVSILHELRIAKHLKRFAFCNAADAQNVGDCERDGEELTGLLAHPRLRVATFEKCILLQWRGGRASRVHSCNASA